jgi:hypothetical protein
MNAPHSVTAIMAVVITITTAPPGLEIVVDGKILTAPQKFSWGAQTSHSIGVISPQRNGGTRYVFTAWSDGKADTHNIDAPSAETTYTATFKTQYLLTTAASPQGLGSVTVSPVSPDSFYDSGTSVQLTAAPANLFLAWSGDLSGTLNPQSLIMNAGRSVTATSAHDGDGAGGITIMSMEVVAPQTFTSGFGNHAEGHLRCKAAAEPRILAGMTAGAKPRLWLQPPPPIPPFQTRSSLQYRRPAGTVTSPASADGFYNNGTAVLLTAAGAFRSWSGDLSGSANPQSVSMSAPRSVTANFEPLPLTSPTLTYSVPGALGPAQQQPVQLNVSSTYSGPIAGQLTLTFVPNAVNNVDDPNVMFTNGSRRVDFTIPANSSVPQFSLPGVMIQSASSRRLPHSNPRIGTVDVTRPLLRPIRVVVSRPVLMADVRRIGLLRVSVEVASRQPGLRQASSGFTERNGI